MKRRLNWRKFAMLTIVLMISFIPMTSRVLAVEASKSNAHETVISKERLDLAEQYFTKLMKQNHVVGGVFGVTYRDKLIRSQGYGTTDLKQDQKPDETTVYSMASVTKVFTATAIYQLQEQGRLNIDRPVSKYIPGFEFKEEEQTDQITLRHLLTHSAGGIGSYQTDALHYKDSRAFDSLQHYVRMLKQVEMKQEPGRKGKYCNGCYDILGRVIEQVSGLSYYDYIQQNILTPLHMNDSVFGQQLGKIPEPRLAKEYNWFLTRKVHMERSLDAFGPAQDPDGGLYSSIRDMSKFLSAQLGFSEHKLKPETIADSRQPYVTTETDNIFYTASGYEMKQLHHKKIFYKPGDGIGSATSILLIPEYNLGITLLVGEFHPGIQQQILEGMASILLGHVPEHYRSTMTLGLFLGIVSMILILLSLIFLFFLIRRVWKERLYAKSLLRSILSLIGYGIAAAPFWFLLIAIRPTGTGFYGYPYDLAIGMVMITAVFTSWCVYYVLVLLTKNYIRLDSYDRR